MTKIYLVWTRSRFYCRFSLASCHTNISLFFFRYHLFLRRFKYLFSSPACKSKTVYSFQFVLWQMGSNVRKTRSWHAFTSHFIIFPFLFRHFKFKSTTGPFLFTALTTATTTKNMMINYFLRLQSQNNYF